MPETITVEPEGDLQQLIPEANELAAKMILTIDDASIFRLSKFSEEADYEKYCKPKSMAIGPFHAHAPALNSFTEDKPLFILAVMSRIGGEEDMKTLMKQLKELEPIARGCYGPDREVSNMKSYEFLKIMITDGCCLFISIALLTFAKELLHNPTTFGNSRSTYLDLIRLENQIPFFILETIYEKYKQVNEDAASSFSEYAVSFLGMTILREHKLCPPEPRQRINHLLHLAKMTLFPPGRRRRPPQPSSWSSLTETRSASELKAYGVKFRTPEVKSNANYFLPDIHFHNMNGVLEIPKLMYNELTAPLLENFLGYETFYHRMEEYDVTSYICFMDSLIREVKDVELLVQSGVLQARITDAEEIVSVFNSLTGGLVIMPEKYHYGRLHRQLKEYCESGPRPLRAKLVHFYHHGRWDFLNTILLSFLTFTQTLFSILAYLVPPKK